MLLQRIVLHFTCLNAQHSKLFFSPRFIVYEVQCILFGWLLIKWHTLCSMSAYPIEVSVLPPGFVFCHIVVSFAVSRKYRWFYFVRMRYEFFLFFASHFTLDLIHNCIVPCASIVCIGILFHGSICVRYFVQYVRFFHSVPLFKHVKKAAILF